MSEWFIEVDIYNESLSANLNTWWLMGRELAKFYDRPTCASVSDISYLSVNRTIYA